MNESPENPSPEVLDRLKASIAEQEAQARPKFRELNRYRQFICDELDANTPPMFVLRSLKEQENLSVSTDTFYRYVAYLRPPHRKNKKTVPAQPPTPSHQPASKAAEPSAASASPPPSTSRARGPRIAPKDI